MTGICIISFDCEGKWGMADHIDTFYEKHLTNDNLINSYQFIVNTLETYNIPATFAFVAALTLDKKYFEDHWLDKLKSSKSHSVWLSKFFDDFDNNYFEGWFTPGLLKLVKKSHISHEIASHGFTHLPFDMASIESLDLEFQGINDWVNFFDIQLGTFIYPRNLVRQPELLKKIDVKGYREAPMSSHYPPIFRRFLNLSKEFYPFAFSQNYKSNYSDSIIPIPGDFFLNWRHGFRKFVPLNLTKKRFKNALLHASKSGGVVHLWSHPHNFITGDRQKELFQSCIYVLNEMVSRGDIKLMTQREFVSHQLKGL
jgi:hypothetical protein